ncbi:uncharacterized protein RCO7_09926 [Rhynchosporium graminicola]|uniref:Lysine-specific metallo-endopeptidase domain-containing protein n=1 Tax=Rhynchosporium graminicola TaxID=2792576 RepID=A0A1E1LL42_9HELO|nr:uncharacterized protein RCO7_09926 [Rhynchosporium commune]
MRPSSLLFGGSLISTSFALPTLPHPNEDLIKRDGPVFDGYIECSQKQTDTINQAFDDAIRLVALPSQLALNQQFSFFPNPCTGICSEGTLETRFWGKDIGKRPDEYSLIQTVYHNIANLRSKSSKIRVSCVNQISPLPGTQNFCRDTPDLGAYAFGTSKEYHDNTIVFCVDGFFNPKMEPLGWREAELNRDTSSRKDAARMYSKAAAMIHELSHLPAIQERDDTIIKDRRNDPVNDYGDKAYGVRLSEKLARRFPLYAAKNADNYAWYATELFFNNLYGIPDAQDAPRDDEPAEVLPKSGRGLVVALYETVSPHFGGADIDHTWKFFTTPLGRGIDCSLGADPVVEINPEGPSDAKFGRNLNFSSKDNMPWPGGDFKVVIDGQECHYKNDGSNAGRLFCPTREISCDADRARKENDDVQKCGGFNMLKPNVFCQF